MQSLAMTNWTARDLKIDFSFLPDIYSAEIFRDGVNADLNGTDYKKEIPSVTPATVPDIHLAPGGGWTARIEKLK